MEIRARHWTLAAAAALGLHAAAAAWVFRAPDAPAASPGGGGGMQVTLAPVAGPSAAEAPAGPRQDAAQVVSAPTVAQARPETETMVPPNPDAVKPPEAETVTEVVPQETPREPVLPEQVEAVRPETPPVPAPEAVPVPQPEVEVARMQDLVIPPPPMPRPEPPRRAAVEPRRPEPTQAAEAPPPAGAVSAASESQGRPSSQSAGGRPGRDSTQGAPSDVAAAPGGAADYMSQLRAWLERHKEYPNRARRQRIEGTALLVFVMDQGGNVLSHRIERSAGDPVLDQAVRQMIERAQPLPAMPASFQQARLEVRVPVQFMLR